MQVEARRQRILILSLYYPPDLSAGSFRTRALIDALVERGGQNLEIDIVTSAPNRYNTFVSETPELERSGNVTIHRITLPSHQSGMVDQARAYVHFARAAVRLARRRQYDLVYATSSRLMTATLGSYVARRLRLPLYLDIRDIFADTMDDILPRAMALPLRPVLSLLERWTIRRAAHVNLVSAGFKPYFQQRYPRMSYSSFTNGIDDEFLAVAPANGAGGTPAAAQPIRVVYAGNMGEGQGLHAIIPALAKRLEGRVSFRLIGDGGRRAELETALRDAGVTNVEVLAPVSRTQLIDEYRNAAVLFLHLNDYDAFKKVLPSKIFEYAALGKPIWAGVSGFAASFLRNEVENVAVFEPCDAAGALRTFDQLSIADAPRDSFVGKFARRSIMRDMAADIMSHARSTTRV